MPAATHFSHPQWLPYNLVEKSIPSPARVAEDAFVRGRFFVEDAEVLSGEASLLHLNSLGSKQLNQSARRQRRSQVVAPRGMGVSL